MLVPQVLTVNIRNSDGLAQSLENKIPEMMKFTKGKETKT